jgi:hypothetical protein
VQQRIKPTAEDVDGKIEDPPNLGVTARELERAFPNWTQCGELVVRRAPGLRRLTGHHDAGTFLEEPARRGQSNPARSSHDETCTAVKPARA